MASPRPNCATVFAPPADSRNVCALNSSRAFAVRLDGFLAFLLDSMRQACHVVGPWMCAQGNRPHGRAGVSSMKTLSPFRQCTRGEARSLSRGTRQSAIRRGGVVEHDTQERIVDFEAAV